MRCRRILVLVLVMTLGSLALAACGSKQNHSYAGYWQSTGGSVPGMVIHILKSGDAYTVSGSGIGELPMSATMKNGKLTAQAPTMGPMMGAQSATMTMTLSADGKTLSVSITALGQPLSGPIAMTRPTVSDAALAAQILNQKNKARDAAVKEGVHALQIGIQTWAPDHSDRYPAADVVVRSNKGFAGYLDHWPVSPYSGAAMKPGDQPGDYTYTRIGTSYKLSGHLGDGSDFTVP
jgi:hypothetical protein